MKTLLLRVPGCPAGVGIPLSNKGSVSGQAAHTAGIHTNANTPGDTVMLISNFESKYKFADLRKNNYEIGKHYVCLASLVLEPVRNPQKYQTSKLEGSWQLPFRLCEAAGGILRRQFPAWALGRPSTLQSWVSEPAQQGAPNPAVEASLALIRQHFPAFHAEKLSLSAPRFCASGGAVHEEFYNFLTVRGVQGVPTAQTLAQGVKEFLLQLPPGELDGPMFLRKVEIQQVDGGALRGATTRTSAYCQQHPSDPDTEEKYFSFLDETEPKAKVVKCELLPPEDTPSTPPASVVAPAWSVQVRSGVQMANDDDMSDSETIPGIPATSQKVRRRFIGKSSPSKGSEDVCELTTQDILDHQPSLDLDGAFNQQDDDEESVGSCNQEDLYDPEVREYAFGRHGAKAYAMLPPPKRRRNV
jgi:hypothetical protein